VRGFRIHVVGAALVAAQRNHKGCPYRIEISQVEEV
jgi:hypothetical protein